MTITANDQREVVTICAPMPAGSQDDVEGVEPTGRRVEVQERGHDADEHDDAKEQDHPVPGQAAQLVAAAAKIPSSSATRPMSNSPATRTNGDQSCAAASRAPCAVGDRRGARSDATDHGQHPAVPDALMLDVGRCRVSTDLAARPVGA